MISPSLSLMHANRHAIKEGSKSRKEKLSTVIRLIIKHVECCITFILYPIRL